MATKKLQLMGVKLVNEEDYGKNAYEIAVNHGFKGTEEDWLESLKPAKGVDYFTEEDIEGLNDSFVDWDTLRRECDDLSDRLSGLESPVYIEAEYDERTGYWHSLSEYTPEDVITYIECGCTVSLVLDGDVICPFSGYRDGAAVFRYFEPYDVDIDGISCCIGCFIDYELLNDGNIFEVFSEFVTVDSLTSMISKYISDDAAPTGFGLGTVAPSVNDLNTMKNCGFFSFTNDCANAPFSYGVGFSLNRYDTQYSQVVFNPYLGGCGETAIRHYVDNNWTEWEYSNPPMLFGAEYRTTERWNGKPVYTQLIDIRLCAGQDEDYMDRSECNIDVAFDVDSLVDSNIIIYDGTYYYNDGVFIETEEVTTSIYLYDGVLTLGVYGVIEDYASATVLLKYTKTTD